MTSLRQRVLWTSMLASATFVSAGAFAQTPAVTPTTPATQTMPATPAVKTQPQASIAEQGKRMERRDPAKRMERMQAHRAKRMAELKTKLALSPSQEGAWTNFTGSTQPPAARPARPDRAEFAKLTTPQRIERMQAHRAERSAMFARRAEATKTFYAALNADQQKTFDAETARLGRGEHRGHHGHDGHDGNRQPTAAKG